MPPPSPLPCSFTPSLEARYVQSLANPTRVTSSASVGSLTIHFSRTSGKHGRISHWLLFFFRHGQYLCVLKPPLCSHTRERLLTHFYFPGSRNITLQLIDAGDLIRFKSHIPAVLPASLLPLAFEKVLQLAQREGDSPLIKVPADLQAKSQLKVKLHHFQLQVCHWLHFLFRLRCFCFSLPRQLADHCVVHAARTGRIWHQSSALVAIEQGIECLLCRACVWSCGRHGCVDSVRWIHLQ